MAHFEFYQRGSWRIGGTLSAGFVVLAESPIGAVGIRQFVPGSFDIRVEPADLWGLAAMEPNFSLRDDWSGMTLSHPWASKDVEAPIDNQGILLKSNNPAVGQAVELALLSLMLGNAWPKSNAMAPVWARALVTSCRPTPQSLAAELRKAKVPGAGGAGHWGPRALAIKTLALLR